MKKSMSNSFRPENLPFYGAVIAIVLAMISIMLCGCSHSGLVVARGKVFTLNERGLTYVNGVLAYDLSRENTDAEVEVQDADGLGGHNGTHQIKGGLKFRRRIGKVVTGYLVDLSKKNPKAAVKYLSDAGLSDADPMPSLPSYDAVGTAIDAAQRIVEKAETEKFVCNGGECSYSDLTGNRDIDYQLSIAMELLKFDGFTNKMPTTGERYVHCLESFVTALVQHRSKGKKHTPLCVKRVKVEDKVVTDLMFEYFPADGDPYEAECPSCVPMLPEDSD